MIAGTEAAKTDQHRHKTAAESPTRRSNGPSQTPRGPYNWYLQDGKEEEQSDDNGQKLSTLPTPAKNAVDDKAVHHQVDAVGGQRIVSGVGHASIPKVSRSDGARADDPEGQPGNTSAIMPIKRGGAVYLPVRTLSIATLRLCS